MCACLLHCIVYQVPFTSSIIPVVEAEPGLLAVVADEFCFCFCSTLRHAGIYFFVTTGGGVGDEVLVGREGCAVKIVNSAGVAAQADYER